MYIFILGLDHTRTTVIDIHLAKELGAISLGEVRRTIYPRGGERAKRQSCTCGKNFEKCQVWSEFSQDPAEMVQKSQYSELHLVDSSKDIKHYRSLNKYLESNITIITYRKFSNWYKSVRASRQREGRDKFRLVFSDRNFLLANLRIYLRGFVLIAWLEWLANNVRLMINAKGDIYFISSKEDLDNAIAMLKNKYECNPQNFSQHIIRGNRVAYSTNFKMSSFNEEDWIGKILRKIKRVSND